MNRKFLVWAGGLLAALLVVGAVGASVAYADDATPPAPPAGAPADGGARHGGRGLPQAELEAAAKVLGMTADELSTALQNGQTLEDLATKAGVDVTAVQDAIKAARDAEMRTRIQQAVTDGTMTQEKADWLLEGLEKGYLDGPGFGFGFGPHSHGGHGGPGGPRDTSGTATNQPAATPTTNP